MAPSPTIRIMVLGTGDFALPMFELLCEPVRQIGDGHEVIALLTQPDRPQGRKQELIPSRIKQAALGRGLPVLQPENVNAPQSLEQIRQFAPDLFVTAAYGQILSPDLLAIPRLGGINLHGSILPAYRGAAPVARAIQNGDAETGVTVILMTPRIDAGGLIAFARTPIDPDETAGELEDRLARLGAPLVVSTIAPLARGEVRIIPQDKTKVTRAAKLRKEDGLIDWSQTAQTVHNLVRAMQPWPLASTTWTSQDATAKAGLRLIIHKTQPLAETAHVPLPPGSVVEAEADRLTVAAGAGDVRILVVQTPGKKPMPVADFLRGHRVRPGDQMKN
ncbi:MAG: methionyl-tRNA formyltransferase [Isosphaeraceae bacterium]